MDALISAAGFFPTHYNEKKSRGTHDFCCESKKVLTQLAPYPPLDA